MRGFSGPSVFFEAARLIISSKAVFCSAAGTPKSGHPLYSKCHMIFSCPSTTILIFLSVQPAATSLVFSSSVKVAWNPSPYSSSPSMVQGESSTLSGKYWKHLFWPCSRVLVSMAMTATELVSCQTIRQK